MMKDNMPIKCEGIKNDYDESEIVIFGVPYDGTASYRPGARFAPQAIRHAIDSFETYSPYQDKEMCDFKYCDLGDMLLPFGNTFKVLDDIKKEISIILGDNKKTVLLGGEHLISFPIITEYINKYPDLNIIQFDAHADLRNDYLGETLSHATVIKRVYEKLAGGKIFQYGIRSGTKEEFEFADNHTKMCKFDLGSLENDIKILGDAPVYITIDLDVLDPSILSGTGTPEPGGICFNELIEGIIKLRKLNIVGADIVELSPHYDASGVSTAVACKILRELLLIMS